MNFVVVDRDGKNRPYGRSPFKVEFDREVPESVLAHKPLTMLIQCLDSRRVRLGFRAGPADAWVLSRVYDLGRVLGKEVARFDMHDWSTATGEMYGAPPGGPMYQKFLIDYVHYRYGLSAK
jgi:hypothetical protein